MPELLLKTYLAVALLLFAGLVSRRTGDAYTDQPIVGCLMCALLWPLMAVVAIWALISGDY